MTGRRTRQAASDTDGVASDRRRDLEEQRALIASARRYVLRTFLKGGGHPPAYVTLGDKRIQPLNRNVHEVVMRLLRSGDRLKTRG